MFGRLRYAKPRSYSPAVVMAGVLPGVAMIGMLIVQTFTQKQPLTTEQWIGTGMLVAVVVAILTLAAIAALTLRRQARGTRR